MMLTSATLGSRVTSGSSVVSSTKNLSSFSKTKSFVMEISIQSKSADPSKLNVSVSLLAVKSVLAPLPAISIHKKIL